MKRRFGHATTSVKGQARACDFEPSVVSASPVVFRWDLLSAEIIPATYWECCSVNDDLNKMDICSLPTTCWSLPCVHSLYLFLALFPFLFIYQSIHMPIHLSAHPFIHPSIDLSVYISPCQFLSGGIPLKLVDLVIGEIGSSFVRLNWTRNLNDRHRPTHLKADIRLADNSFVDQIGSSISDAESGELIIDGLQPSTMYFIIVIPSNQHGDSKELTMTKKFRTRSTTTSSGQLYTLIDVENFNTLSK